MSPYEQGTGSNVLGGGGSRLPMGGNTDRGQRDSGYLVVSNVGVGGRLDKTGAVAGRCPGDEAVGKPRSQGVCEPALEPWRRGKGLWRKSQDFQPDRGNPAVRPYRGATGNVAMVGMRTRLAIERAGTVTPHLKRGAPVLYPNPNGNGEQWIGRTYGAMAPVLDPTRHQNGGLYTSGGRPRLGPKCRWFRLLPYARNPHRAGPGLRAAGSCEQPSRGDNKRE